MKNDHEFDETLEKLKQELRRGVIVLAVLHQLREEQYGYSLIKSLEESGFPISQDTLYPLLRRLESQGLLDSEWRMEEPKPRRYYYLNQIGYRMLDLLKSEWQEQEKILRSLFS